MKLESKLIQTFESYMTLGIFNNSNFELSASIIGLLETLCKNKLLQMARLRIRTHTSQKI